jgi:peptide/nickel transport system substrate-binding protein
VSAARAVLQTGEFDFAWNTQVEDEILMRMEEGGKGKVVVTESGNIEHIQLNNADPWTEVDGERSSVKTRHPLLSDPAVRQALALLVDRASVQRHIYGRTGIATANFLNSPERFRSHNTRFEFDVEKASQVLEAGGWQRGGDGIRVKDGKRLKLVFQTAINAPRQKTQAIVKQACQKAGIEIELKSVTASVFFSSDAGNSDTYTKFYCDLQMYNAVVFEPDAGRLMRQFTSWEVATKENKWQGRNVTRWRNDAYDRAFRAAEGELDPVKRAALFIEMNDLVVNEQVVIPVVQRPWVNAVSNRMRLELSGWDTSFWNLAEWYRVA